MGVNRADFANAVSLVLPGVARKELFAQANKLGISNGRLISYNDEISIHTHFPQLEGVEGALDGVLLYELLQRITATDIECSTTDTQFVIAYEQRDVKQEMKATLKLLPLELPLGEIDRSNGNDIPLPDTIKNDLRLIGDICATDMSRPLLTCIHLSDGWIEGSDSYRLARKRLNAESELPDILLPAVAGLKIAQYDKLASLSMGSQGEWAHFTLGQAPGSNAEPTVVSSRVFGGTYPDLSEQFEIPNGKRFELPKRLSGALARASVFAHREHSIDEEIEVTMTSKGGRFRIRASDENGKFEEMVKGLDNLVDAQFKIHPSFFKLAIEGENTRCEINDQKIKFFEEDAQNVVLWEHVIALR